ncbi:hypothetical protein ADICYQ_1310 [Cyclobacterium qasimii M12-11B]|uniref:Uncharacterized protein n=1 Tax=Cyclobacterium qasimii M12-11B TaxID=641524 RepID=S7VH17_9BACT|nr:hypothetical protein ADICYQ_1310 [Cyclobacterium qasimii M12-11B]
MNQLFWLFLYRKKATELGVKAKLKGLGIFIYKITMSLITPLPYFSAMRVSTFDLFIMISFFKGPDVIFT